MKRVGRKLTCGETDRQIVKSPEAFSKVIALWVPRRFVTSSGVNLPAFVAGVNNKIQRRAFVLWGGQVPTKPMDTDERIDVIFEPDSPGSSARRTVCTVRT